MSITADPKRLLFGRPWLLSETYLSDLKTASSLVDFKSLSFPAGDTCDDSPCYQTINGIAVIPIQGVLMKSASVLDLIMGEVAIIGDIQAAFDQAMADMEVKTILFCCDSPGGSVSGVPELATHIWEAKNKSSKLVIGFGDGGMVCSGAYWILSQCDVLAVSEATLVGSIGCIATAQDSDRMLRNAGVDSHYFRSSPMKGAGGDGFQEVHGRDLQAQVERFGQMFTDAALTRGRGMTAEKIAALGDPAACWIGQDSVDVGLADEVTTVESLLTRYATKSV